MYDVVGGDMVEFTKTIKDPLGLHARPVALLYDIIAKHRCDVSVSIAFRVFRVSRRARRFSHHG